MTPPINPAFSKYVTHVQPELPPSFAKNKERLVNLEKGLTVHGTPRQRPSPRLRKFKKGQM